MNELTYEKVWSTLSRIECNNTDKKGKFTYMSWGVAWLELMKVYPHAQYEFLPETYGDNGTVMVHCIVRIGSLERYMWLPPMDFNMNSIKNPTSREISDARMRCLVKCIAMFGLGHHIFSNKDSSVYGEDLPDQAKDRSERAVVDTEYSIVSKDGEDLGIYIGESELFKELKSHLGVKKADVTDDHIVFFQNNRPTIEFAIDRADESLSISLNKVLSFYDRIVAEKELLPVENNEKET